MRIKEFFIKRYGPLHDKSYALSSSLNLLFGKNEDGKTLTIDALVKMLLGKNIKDFKRIDRVDENPEGYLIVEDDEGKEVKLPEKGTLTKIVDLTPSECRNIFVIRNSDLSISPEGEFYTSVTDRLVGVRTEEISKIRETLREAGRLTPSGSFRDTKDDKLKTRIENAAGLIRKIETLAMEVREEEYDKLETQSASYRVERDRLTQEIENLEDARKREKYEKGREALANLKESLRKLRGLEIYTANTAQLWRDCERDIQSLEEDRKGVEADIEREEAELKNASEKFDEKDRAFQVLEEIKSKLDNEVRPDLSQYERNREEFDLKRERSKFLSPTWMVSTLLLCICLLGIILRPSLFFFILAGLFLAATLVSWILKYRFVRYKTSLETAFERIRLTLSKCELSAESMEGIASNIQRFDGEYRRKHEELQSLERKRENLEGRIRELRDRRIPDIDRKIRGAIDKIDKIIMESNQRSLEAYTEKLRLKEEFQRSTGEGESVLKSHFGEAPGTLEQNVEHWEKEISTLEIYRDSALEEKYSEDAISKLERERQEFDEKLDEIRRKMGSFQKAMAEIERKVNDILRFEQEYLYCKTSVDLEAARNELQAFIDENERSKDNVLKAMSILDDIAIEERERVSELFDTRSPISRYFRGITGGIYGEVTLNQRVGGIEVKREDGGILGAEKLSGGAYDQLYFSIRLALGERLLKGKKGFFILDDPFIKADPDRLGRQIEMLKRISGLGWQVMYFSAKEEIENALGSDIESGVVHRIDIQPMAS